MSPLGGAFELFMIFSPPFHPLKWATRRNPNPKQFSNLTFSLSFPRLKSSCRPKITRINNSRYYPGKATSPIQTTRRLMRWLMRRPTAIGRFSISYRWRFIWLKKFVLSFVGKLTYHKCSFTFPLLIIQIRTQKRAFFSLSCHKPHSFRTLYIVKR